MGHYTARGRRSIPHLPALTHPGYTPAHAPDFPDTSADAVDWLLSATGYSVAWIRDGDTLTAIATHSDGSRHEAHGTDPHAVVCALAELCGVELEE